MSRGTVTFIHTGRAALSLAALECGSARAGLEKKAETSSSPTDQGLCFVMPDLHCFMQKSDGRQWLWSASLCLRNLTQVYRTESAFNGSKLWKKAMSVFPCAVLSITQCPGCQKHSWPIPVALENCALAFILCMC